LKILEYYQSFNKNLNCFVESLDCLEHPETRFKYWIDNIQELMKEGTKESKIRAAKISKLMYDNMARDTRKFIDRDIGRYKQYVKVFEPVFKEIFGEDGSKLLKLDYAQFAKGI
jgi:hypothetical protein